MAHLRKRGPKKYQIIVELGRDPVTNKRKRKYVTVKNVTKKEAQKKMLELMQKYEDGSGLVEPKDMTFKELAKQYMNSHQHNIAQRTYDRYSGIVDNHLIPAFGNYKVDQIKAVHIQSYQNQKLTNGKRRGEGGLSRATVAMHHNLLSSLFSEAQKLDLIDKNPVKLVSTPKAKRPKNNFLDEEQVNQLIEAADSQFMKDYIRVAVACGLRRGEQIGLEWKDVDLKNKKVSITQALKRTSKGIELGEPKTSSSRRSIAITDDIVAVFKRIKKRQAKQKLALGSDYNTRFNLIFCEDDGRYCNPNTVTRRFKRAAKKIGLDDIKLHDLRHTMASLMLKSGANPKIVQERLGHASIMQTMDRYSHLSFDLQQEAAEDLSSLLDSGS